MAVCIISVVVVIAAVVAIVLLVNNNGGKSPEDVMKTYLEALQEGNTDKLVNIIDSKGAYAWVKCNGKAEKFEEAYNSISDSEVDAFDGMFKLGLKTTLTATKGAQVEITINKIEKPEELAKGLYKVKANIRVKGSAFGISQDKNRDISIVVYNGKYIGEAK